MNPSFQDSLQYLQFQLMKASGYAVQCDQANDTIIARATREVGFWKGEHHMLATRHMLGIILGFLFLSILIGVLIWKGRKIRAHYKGLIEYVNFNKDEMKRVQEKLQDYEEDFEPIQLITTTQVSLWPRFYTRILLGATGLFVFLYLLAAF